jgi:hypothetical protein
MPEQDWAAQTADTIEQVVDSIRSKTADPLQSAARWTVYGLLALPLLLAALILFAVGAIRALDAYLPYHPLARRVWSADAIVGGLFSLLGMFAWSKRRRRGGES